MSLTLLQRKEVRNIPLNISFLVRTVLNWDWHLRFFIMSMIPILVLYLTLQKYIIGGITSGAVKG